MTKNSPHKATVRAYMAAQGVNYTTAARALAAPSQATVPALDPDQLRAALIGLSQDTAALTRHTATRVSHVTPDLARLSLTALATHGNKRSNYHDPAVDIIRSAILGLPTGHPSVTAADIGYTLAALRDDTALIVCHATASGTHPTHLTDALTGCITALKEPNQMRPDKRCPPEHEHDAAGCYDCTCNLAPASTGYADHIDQRRIAPHHYLDVTTEPLTEDDLAELTADEATEYLLNPDRDYNIECPGLTEQCEGWIECQQTHTEEDRDTLEDTGEAHGVEHQHMHFGWATATGQCSLYAFSDAWIDSASDLNLPPGRYAVDFDWNEDITLILITH